VRTKISARGRETTLRSCRRSRSRASSSAGRSSGEPLPRVSRRQTGAWYHARPSPTHQIMKCGCNGECEHCVDKHTRFHVRNGSLIRADTADNLLLFRTSILSTSYFFSNVGQKPPRFNLPSPGSPQSQYVVRWCAQSAAHPIVQPAADRGSRFPARKNSRRFVGQD